MIRKRYFISLIFVLFFGLFLSSVELNQALPLIDRNEEEFIHYLQVAQRNRSQGNYGEALRYFNQALDLARKVKLRDEILEALEGKSIVLWNLGRMEEAAACFREGLQLARDWNLHLAAPFFQTGLEIYQLYQEGKSRRQKMDYAGSLASFERAIVLARKIRCPELELKCLRQASLVFYDQNEMEKYRAFNEKGLRMARLLSHGLEEGRFLNNIGLYYLEKRDLLASFNILNKASLLLETEGTKADVADNLYNLGLAISFLGFYDRAIKYFRRAMEIDKELGKTEAYIFDLNNIGLCLLNKGRINHDLTPVREAITYFREALHLSEENKLIKRKTMVLNNLANALFLLGERDEALSCIKTGLELSKKINDIYQQIVINDTLGSFYTQSDPQKALDHLFQSLHLSLKSPAYKDEWTLYYHIGRSYESLKAYDLAVEFYNKSINLIEILRRKIDYDFYQVGFLRNKQEVFDALIRVKKKVYDEQNNSARKEELFNCIERTKAKSFLYTLNSPDLNPGTLIDETENESVELKGEIYDLFSRIESFKKREETQFDILRREDLSLTLAAERRREAPNANPIEEKWISLKEIQEKLLDEDTAILEYYLADWGSLAIIVTKNDFQIIDLLPRKSIEDSVTGYAKLISNPPIKNLSGEDTARRIYREIFKPVEDRFPPGLKNLIIVPDGLLYCLPFEALMRDNDNQAEYLVERYNIVYAPSISALNILMGRKNQFEKEDKDILAIGYPQYELFFKEKKNQKNIDLKRISTNMLLQNNLQISSLPYTKKEIRTITSLFPQEKRDIYLGEKASEGAVKNSPLDKYKIIHFACHGYLDEGFPFRSALILTPEPERGEDGFLQAHEISELKLRARLVVLSACQSARGPLEKAEGILSLNRVFFTCGARAVISSLWKVNDRASSDLMGYFYRQLKQGTSIAAALRTAKRKMLTSRFKHPFYWAGNVLSGDGLSVLFDQK